MKCQNCGNDLEKDAKFCENCGEKSVVENNVMAETKDKASKKKSINFKTIIAVVIIAIVLFGGVRFLGGAGSSNKKDFVTYVGEEDGLNIITNEKKLEILNLSYATDAGSIEYSDDGKKIYFLANQEGETSSLYCADISKMKVGSDKNGNFVNVISSNVIGMMEHDYGIANQDPIAYLEPFSEELIEEKTGLNWSNKYKLINAGEAVLYMKSQPDSSSGKLYLYDGKDSISVDKDVMAFAVSKSGTSIIYFKGDEYEKNKSLYYKDLSKESDSVKIDTFNKIVNISDDLNSICYLRYHDEKEKYYDMYLWDVNSETKKVMSEVGGVANYVDETTFLYYKNEMKVIDLNDFVIDSYATRDIETRKESYNERNETDEQYRDRRERENIREDIKEQGLYEEMIHPLYLRKDGMDTLIAENIMVGDYFTRAASKKNILFYEKKEISSPKEVNIENFASFYELQNAILYGENNNEAALSSGAYDSKYGWGTGKSGINIITKDWKEIPIDFEMGFSTIYLEKDKKLYVLEMEDGIQLLVCYDISDKLSNRTVIDEDVYFLRKIPGYDKVFYYKNLESNVKGDLYVYEEGEKNLISNDVFIDNKVYEDGSIMLIKDIKTEDEADSSYILEIYNNGTKETIADNVMSYIYKGKNDIYYITDYSSYSGKMYHYEGKGSSKLVKENVRCMWAGTALEGKTTLDVIRFTVSSLSFD